MSLTSKTTHLLLELADRCFLFASEGRSGPYAAGLGRTAYEAVLRARQRKHNRNQLLRLKQQRLITIRKQGKDFLLNFTDQGKILVLKDRIIQKKASLPTGQYCLVSFDIPEKIRRVRWAFRDLLRQAKFQCDHQSVWISHRDVGEELHMLTRFLHAQRWIHVYQVVENK